MTRRYVHNTGISKATHLAELPRLSDVVTAPPMSPRPHAKINQQPGPHKPPGDAKLNAPPAAAPASVDTVMPHQLSNAAVPVHRPQSARTNLNMITRPTSAGRVGRVELALASPRTAAASTNSPFNKSKSPDRGRCLAAMSSSGVAGGPLDDYPDPVLDSMLTNLTEVLPNDIRHQVGHWWACGLLCHLFTWHPFVAPRLYSRLVRLTSWQF